MNSLLVNECAIVIPVYAGCALLNAFLPGKRVTGYACNRKGNPLRYKLNGLYVMLIVAAAWGVLSFWFQLLNPTDIANTFWLCLTVAFAMGFIGSIILYRNGIHLEDDETKKYSRCSTADRPTNPKPSQQDLHDWENRSALSHFFLGQEINPRLGPSISKCIYTWWVPRTFY